MPRRNRLSIAAVGWLLALPLLGLACAKKPTLAASSDPEFDKKWAELARAGAEVSYIEDDRGEGLMGNVRRASRVKAEPPAASPSEAVADGLPLQPSGEQVQRIIRSNLMAVRGCYMSMARTGQARSGKAIVTFTIGADGKATGLKVDAPSFVDTPLPRCVTAQISHWEFPKSQRGGGQVSYPFVFVSS
ncbi:MAG: AgmX/PglI C-terminal domain-containing protein [Deltaproteobacteria bacterium]|nr:AgmX/PglI C-terminal domain-containing protein [Deltaproteobacteria bacterium]